MVCLLAELSSIAEVDSRKPRLLRAGLQRCQKFLATSRT